MGDTGSLILGFTVSILAIKFIEFNRLYTGNSLFRIEAVPAVTLSIIIIPVFDTIRVFFLRLLQRKSPFQADRKHLHHILIDIGFSHHKVTCILVSLNLALILFRLFFKDKLLAELILGVTILIMIASAYVFKSLKKS
jgi:UDP-N-acetylmuramyl pentapeptide phosphotransferase/UDP-N-acetylglucosamine-1-phosphate transferase